MHQVLPRRSSFEPAYETDFSGSVRAAAGRHHPATDPIVLPPTHNLQFRGTLFIVTLVYNTSGTTNKDETKPEKDGVSGVVTKVTEQAKSQTSKGRYFGPSPRRPPLSAQRTQWAAHTSLHDIGFRTAEGGI